MSKLVAVTSRVAYLPGAVNLGLIFGANGEAIAIDSGLDGEAARKLRRAAEAEGHRLMAVINTHSHADHCGGNHYLAEKAGATVLASRMERAFIENPLLEPVMLFSGAYPPPGMRTRFLMAEPSQVHRVVDDGPLEIAGCQLEIVSLQGHSFGQIGVAFDGVLFAGDAFFGPETIEKHKVPFVVNPGLALEALSSVAARGEGFFLPGHGPLCRSGEELSEVLEANSSRIRLVRSLVERSLALPVEEAEVVGQVCSGLSLEPKGEGIYHLVRTSVVSYLGWLASEGKATMRFDGGVLKWSR